MEEMSRPVVYGSPPLLSHRAMLMQVGMFCIEEVGTPGDPALFGFPWWQGRPSNRGKASMCLFNLWGYTPPGSFTL